MIQIIQGRKQRDRYYYNNENMTISDKEGNTLKLYESLDGMTKTILRDTVDNMFHKYYRISNIFKEECKAIKESDIDWEAFK